MNDLMCLAVGLLAGCYLLITGLWAGFQTLRMKSVELDDRLADGLAEIDCERWDAEVAS